MNKERIKEIVKEQWGDQSLHLVIGAVLTYLLCTWTGLQGVIPVAVGWIVWEHSQYPSHNSKGYDDASLDRLFQELGIVIGVWAYL